MSRVQSLRNGAFGTLRQPRLGKRAAWSLTIFAVTIALAIVLSFFLDKPIQRYVERQMNARLQGYTVSIRKLSFHPVGLSLTLYDLIDGYVKPLFGGLDVYHPEQDREKTVGQRLYEKAVEGVSKSLKNAPRQEVATVATISGPVEIANANSVEVISKLIQNAFFKAILPGLDREVRGLAGRARGKES